MIPSLPSFPPCPPEPCATRAPAVRRYIGDTWSFPYIFLQPKVDALGNLILDASGNPVPDPTNPVILTGSIMSAELYTTLNPAAPPVATLGTSTDADANLAIGKFKIVVPSAVTETLRPDPPFVSEHMTRLAVIQTDSLGNATTLAVQHIAVVAR